jgi:hypothetical protein
MDSIAAVKQIWKSSWRKNNSETCNTMYIGGLKCVCFSNFYKVVYRVDVFTMQLP